MFIIAAIALVYLGKVMIDTFRVHLEIDRIQSERIGQVAVFATGIAKSLTAAVNDDKARATEILESLKDALTAKTDPIQSK
jgi:hypothetical protein